MLRILRCVLVLPFYENFGLTGTVKGSDVTNLVVHLAPPGEAVLAAIRPGVTTLSPRSGRICIAR
jgi:hypothetical protein